MRAIWTGAIGFGLVNIPVKMYTATERSELNFDMLDKDDLSRIKFKRVNENTGKEVAFGNIVKGYKTNNKYVVLTKQDFESAAAKKTNTIEISEFIKEEEIDSIYFENPYFLEPVKTGSRAYALLREALQKTGMVGIATFVMHNKENLSILRSSNEVIILNRIRFSQEVRDPGELHLPEKATIKKSEMDMAISLIKQLSGKFDITAYKDTYTKQLLSLINAKQKGKKVSVPNMKVVHSEKEDLMSQLKASLNPTTLKSKKAS